VLDTFPASTRSTPIDSLARAARGDPDPTPNARRTKCRYTRSTTDNIGSAVITQTLVVPPSVSDPPCLPCGSYSGPAGGAKRTGGARAPRAPREFEGEVVGTEGGRSRPRNSDRRKPREGEGRPRDRADRSGRGCVSRRLPPYRASEPKCAAPADATHDVPRRRARPSRAAPLGRGAAARRRRASPPFHSRKTRVFFYSWRSRRERRVARDARSLTAAIVPLFPHRVVSLDLQPRGSPPRRRRQGRLGQARRRGEGDGGGRRRRRRRARARARGARQRGVHRRLREGQG